MRKVLIATTLLLLFTGTVVSTGMADSATKAVLSDTVDVYYPATISGKLPVVFFAHNGGAKKEDWGDFPSQLAAEGYVTASIGWSQDSDPARVIDHVFKTYGQYIDENRVAFVGGCHGGVIMTRLMNQKLPFQLKTAVFLSLSESVSLPETHPPILGFYSTNDHLGAYYQMTTKRILATGIGEPKKVVEVKGTPHGNELVTDDSTKAMVRTEISSWLKKYLADSK